MADISSSNNSSNWTTSEDEEIRELQAKLKEHAKAKVSIFIQSLADIFKSNRYSTEDDEQRTAKSLTKRVFRKRRKRFLHLEFFY
jgi:hypothetical protein